MKPDDFAIDATSLKRFFKQQYGIPVRVRRGQSKFPYINVWIPYNNGGHTGLVYDYSFPPELGNLCLGVIYGVQSDTAKQSWGGNVQPHMIAMHTPEWQRVLAAVHNADKMIVALATADAAEKGDDIDDIRPADRII